MGKRSITFLAIMNKGQISNALRRLGLLYSLDKVRYKLQQRSNKTANAKFKKENPAIALPPDYLMYESFQLDYDKYYSGGLDTAKWLIELLEEHTDLKEKNILDWGCGPARIVRHLPHLTNYRSTINATDYNVESIKWCKEHIEGVEFNLNGLDATLPYNDAAFDVIYGISIFTHLSEEMHTAWIKELTRILKDDGILLLTMQGENFRPKLSSAEKIKFDTGELILRGNVKEGHRTYSAFHPDKYLYELFDHLTILEKLVIDATNKNYTPQDTWILKK